MNIENVYLISIFSSLYVLVPFFLSLINFKLVITHNKWLFFYLLCSIIAELFGHITYKIIKIYMPLTMMIFTIFETILFILIISERSNKLLKKIYLFSIVFIFLVLFIDLAFLVSPPFYTFTVSFSKFILLLCFLIFLLKNNSNLELYERTCVYSILFFTVSTITIFTFAGYFTTHVEYQFIFTLILNIANLIYYTLFSISIIQLKKLYSSRII